MKEISELNLPKNILYTKDHEWIDTTSDPMRVGISDYAQDQLGEIVFVELPEAGTSRNRGDQFGTVESVKAVSETFMPVGGEVININTDLSDRPELMNESPYEKGWMMEIRVTDPEELKTLMDRDAYRKFLEGIR
ncbi:MAG: glycine cleavage system protein GcvH [Desulfobacteraceae bacterium]|nr:MAG: glycine cleavage system protein GcvH [Desulfobacteraceae bacterium]